MRQRLCRSSRLDRQSRVARFSLAALLERLAWDKQYGRPHDLAVRRIWERAAKTEFVLLAAAVCVWLVLPARVRCGLRHDDRPADLLQRLLTVSVAKYRKRSSSSIGGRPGYDA